MDAEIRPGWFSFFALPLAAASLLSGCPSSSASPANTDVVPEFDAARAWKLLEEQVAIGMRPSGSEGAEKTRALIERELSSYGLAPVRQAFKEATPLDPQGLEFCNVYADLAVAGDTGRTSPMVLLVSHYDTKRMDGFVGANDAGSSTAVLLELARQVAAGGPRRVTYRFLFVDGEEAVRQHWQDPDNRYGSRHHAAQLPKSGDKNRVKAAIVIDMVGDKDLQIQRDDNSTAWLYEAFAASARKNGLAKYVDGLREPLADDHLSFRDIGIPALDLIDLKYGPNNSWWHTTDDTLDKCAVESLSAIGRIVLLGLPAVEERALR